MFAACSLLACLATAAWPAAAANPADNPKYYQRDPHEVVVTDIAAWSNPTKEVFRKHHLKLTKVQLMWNRKFPVFHVADFGADPGSGAADSFFAPLLSDLLKANGGAALKIVEDSTHDGFVVAYDPKTRAIFREMVQDEKP